MPMELTLLPHPPLLIKANFRAVRHQDCQVKELRRKRSLSGRLPNKVIRIVA